MMNLIVSTDPSTARSHVQENLSNIHLNSSDHGVFYQCNLINISVYSFRYSVNYNNFSCTFVLFCPFLRTSSYLPRHTIVSVSFHLQLMGSK